MGLLADVHMNVGSMLEIYRESKAMITLENFSKLIPSSEAQIYNTGSSIVALANV